MEYKILVADDDKEIREAIEIYLTNEQIESPYSLWRTRGFKMGTWGQKSWYTPYYYGFNDA